MRQTKRDTNIIQDVFMHAISLVIWSISGRWVSIEMVNLGKCLL